MGAVCTLCSVKFQPELSNLALHRASSTVGCCALPWFGGKAIFKLAMSLKAVSLLWDENLVVYEFDLEYSLLTFGFASNSIDISITLLNVDSNPLIQKTTESRSIPT